MENQSSVMDRTWLQLMLSLFQRDRVTEYGDSTGVNPELTKQEELEINKRVT